VSPPHQRDDHGEGGDRGAGRCDRRDKRVHRNTGVACLAWGGGCGWRGRECSRVWGRRRMHAAAEAPRQADQVGVFRGGGGEAPVGEHLHICRAGGDDIYPCLGCHEEHRLQAAHAWAACIAVVVRAVPMPGIP